MLSSRTVARIMEAEQSIELEIRERRIADLLDLKADFLCFLDETEYETIRATENHQFFDQLRSKGEPFSYSRIACEEQEKYLENQEKSDER